MTKEKFLSEMSWFLEFYDVTQNKTQTKIWFEIFGALPVEIFNKSLTAHIKEDLFPGMPALGKITERVRTYVPKSRPLQ